MLPLQSLQSIVIIGNILLLLAAAPQFYKIFKTKKTDDLSILTWLVQLIADLLLLFYSMNIGDTLGTMIFTIFCIEVVVMMVFIQKYKQLAKPIQPAPNIETKHHDNKSSL
jgi:uncharacterized protein with PQ loop repeat